MSLLADIVAAKHVEIAALRARARTITRRDPIDVVARLRRAEGAPLRLIAEVKLRSPSAGALSRALAPAERALAYAEAGASMVSVLCDTTFFDGSWDDLGAARAKLDGAGPEGRYRSLPLLAKDFVLDERQIEEARDRGADAVLLIARILSKTRLGELAEAARRERIEPLVEVIDERELEDALSIARAHVIGVNARDLDTLQMDSDRTARVLSAIPTGVVAIHLSGLRSASDVALVARERPDAALLGEALMRKDDPRPLLAELVHAARGG